MLANNSGSVHASCGLVKFCFSAGRLAQLDYLAGQLEVVVLTNAPAYVRSLCRTAPRPRVLRPDRRLENAIARHRAALDRNAPLAAGDDGRVRTNAMAGLAKWQLVGQSEYTAVLAVDLDVDLFLYSAGAPPTGGLLAEVLRHAWLHALPAFLNATELELVARSDWHAPINTGVLLLKPSRDAHALGLRALESGSFDPRLGWERVGPPRRALALEALPAAVAARANAAFMRTQTVMLREDTWSFVAAEGDQGLFAYVYLALRRFRSFSHSGEHAPWGRSWPLGQRWLAHHFFYAHKPWAPWGRCGPYFDFLARPGLDLDARSTCGAILQEKRRCLAAQVGASLAPAQCAACGRGPVAAHMADDESRAQLHWACGQAAECHTPSNVAQIEWDVF